MQLGVSLLYVDIIELFVEHIQLQSYSHVYVENAHDFLNLLVGNLSQIQSAFAGPLP